MEDSKASSLHSITQRGSEVSSAPLLLSNLAPREGNGRETPFSLATRGGGIMMASFHSNVSSGPWMPLARRKSFSWRVKEITTTLHVLGGREKTTETETDTDLHIVSHKESWDGVCARDTMNNVAVVYNIGNSGVWQRGAGTPFFEPNAAMVQRPPTADGSTCTGRCRRGAVQLDGVHNARMWIRQVTAQSAARLRSIQLATTRPATTRFESSRVMSACIGTAVLRIAWRIVRLAIETPKDRQHQHFLILDTAMTTTTNTTNTTTNTTIHDISTLLSR